MWSTLAMTAALSFAPQQASELKLTNARPTYGLFGNPRKDAESPKLLVGDAFFVSFDIENLKVAADGRVKYSMGMELTKDGKIQLSKAAEKLEAYNTLGGSRVPAFVATEIGTDTKPGTYKLTAIVTDLSTRTTKRLSKTFEVVPATFGLVRLGFSYNNQDATPAPPVGVPGQRLVFTSLAAGFERDKKTKKPHISVSMRILENGKPVLAKPYTGSIKDVPENFKLAPINFIINLNRSGKFTIELKATDEISKKTATATLNLTVLEVK